MTDQQILTRFNPQNREPLTPEELEVFRNLTDDQINQLAKEYPNQPSARSYLILYDDHVPANKQMLQLSTWQNLRNIRKFSNKKNFRPWEFKGIATPRELRQTVQPRDNKKVVVDMSAQEAAQQLREAIKKGEEPKTAKPSALKVENKATEKQKAAVEKAKVKAAEKVKSAVKAVPEDQQFDAT